jgi:peptidoglycan-associated lipoprotein
MKHLVRCAVFAGLAAVVAGCSSTPKSESSGDIVASPTAGTEGDGSAASGAGGAVNQGLQTVYFEFDSYVLSSDARSALTAGAEALKGTSGSKVQIEGHCDERGSNEYNLALGEKRARAVEEFLIGLGVSKDSLSTISYGEERPVAPGSDEDSWSKNRRAEFVGL